METPRIKGGQPSVSYSYRASLHHHWITASHLSHCLDNISLCVKYILPSLFRYTDFSPTEGLCAISPEADSLDDQRRRKCLAGRPMPSAYIGSAVLSVRLAECAPFGKPDTLVRWHRKGLPLPSETQVSASSVSRRAAFHLLRNRSLIASSNKCLRH